MTLGLKDILLIDGMSHKLEITHIEEGVINGFRFDDRLFIPAEDIGSVKKMHEKLSGAEEKTVSSLIVCSKCGVEQPASEFYGKKKQCKTCVAKYNEEYNKKHHKGRYKDRFNFKSNVENNVKKDDAEKPLESPDAGHIPRHQETYEYVKKILLERKPVEFTSLEVANIITLFYKNQYHQTLATGQPYAMNVLRRLRREGIVSEGERHKNGGPFFFNLVDAGKGSQGDKKKDEHPAPVKNFEWNSKRDGILVANYDDLGVSGIFDKGLLPGFTMTEIRRRCQDLKLMDEYGNKIE